MIRYSSAVTRLVWFHCIGAFNLSIFYRRHGPSKRTVRLSPDANRLLNDPRSRSINAYRARIGRVCLSGVFLLHSSAARCMYCSTMLHVVPSQLHGYILGFISLQVILVAGSTLPFRLCSPEQSLLNDSTNCTLRFLSHKLTNTIDLGLPSK